MRSDILSIKGYIFNFKKYAIHDGPGIRSTVFLQGCPLQCWWCHNPESREPYNRALTGLKIRNCLRPLTGQIPDSIIREVSVDELLREIKKDVIFYDQSGGGVSFSGGEPLIQVEFLHEILKACKESSIHTVVDTSGYAEWPLFERVLNFIDLFLFDLKIWNKDLHQKYTGVSNEIILKNLENLVAKSKEIIIRIPLIPGITDTMQNLMSIASFVSNLTKIKRVDLLPYNRMGEKKYRKLKKQLRFTHFKHQNDGELSKMKTIFTDLNFDVQIRG